MLQRTTNLSQNTRYLDQDSNWGTSEYGVETRRSFGICYYSPLVIVNNSQQTTLSWSVKQRFKLAQKSL